ADDEKTHLAARRFDRLIDFARRRSDAFGPNLEVINQAFDGCLHFLARRRHQTANFRAERPLRWDFFYCLLADFRALFYLRDAHLIPRVDIPSGLRLDFEIKFVVARIGEILADVIIAAAPAKRRARNGHGDGVVELQHANALRAQLPNWILREQILVLRNVTGQSLEEARNPFEVARRRFERQSANAEITC